MKQGFTYWIHLPEHADVLTQGYVGITATSVEDRYRQHKSAALRGDILRIHNAIRKYGDTLVVDTLYSGDYLKCLDLEFKLRPTENIGYNIAPGGCAINLGRKHSDETKAKISEANRRREITPETRSKMSKARLGVPLTNQHVANIRAAQRLVPYSLNKQRAIESAAKVNSELPPWRNPFAIQGVWLQAGDVFNYMLGKPSDGVRKVGRGLNITHTQLSVMFKKIRSGWNPWLDSEWLIFSSKLTPDASGDKSLESASSQI